MVKTRFDGSEKTVIEKVLKLAGKRNKVAQTVLIEMLGDNTSSLSHKYLGMVLADSIQDLQSYSFY